MNLFVGFITLSTPAVPNCCCSKGPAPKLDNQLISQLLSMKPTVYAHLHNDQPFQKLFCLKKFR